MNNIETLNSNDIEQVHGGHEVKKCTVVISEDGNETIIHCKVIKHEHPQLG